MPLCSVDDNGTMRQGVHWVPLGTDRRRESRLLVMSALARHGLKKPIAWREGLFNPLNIFFVGFGACDFPVASAKLGKCE